MVWSAIWGNGAGGRGAVFIFVLLFANAFVVAWEECFLEGDLGGGGRGG